ncbi:XdhC family protein [Rhizobium sp.]|uniref:XdhC family protein n=1 Tax=Rhizobium sp. TaxID=391 RepID=UPI0028A5E107
MNAYSQSQLTEHTAPRSEFATDDPVLILRHARDSLEEGVPVALVTLVDISGGAARPLGAQMSVRIDGRYCGFVSGGCTEPAVAAEAIEALRAGHDRFLLLGEGSPFFDIVLPCGSGIRLSIHVLKDAEAIDQVLAHIGGRREAALLYKPAEESLVWSPADDTGWQNGSFARIYRPPARIVISGNALENDATARVALAAGYGVDLVGRSNGRKATDLQLDRYTAVVLLNHDLDAEIATLEVALKSEAFYIGALGSRRTHERRRKALEQLGYGEADILRIKAPIGIFEKARDASSLALSVVADVAAAASKGTYRSVIAGTIVKG